MGCTFYNLRMRTFLYLRVQYTKLQKQVTHHINELFVNVFESIIIMHISLFNY